MATPRKPFAFLARLPGWAVAFIAALCLFAGAVASYAVWGRP